MSPVVKRFAALLVLSVVAGLAATVGCGPDSKTKGKGQQAKPDAAKPDAPKPDAAKPDAPKPDEAKPEGAKPQAAEGVKKSALLVDLPTDVCNTPDGMCLLPDGSVILSVPNFNEDQKLPPLLGKITKDNQFEVFFKLPDNPDTKKPFGPLGVCVEPSGNLLVADFQQEGDRTSRVVRIVVKDGKPVEAVPVITGFHVSNAVVIRDGNLYVSETVIDAKAKPAVSGVMRFKLDELTARSPWRWPRTS